MEKIWKHVLPFVFMGLIVLPVQSCHEAACEEDPKENCMCTHQYDPVCGCNGKTYGNACAAECMGITEYTEGACE